MIYWFTEVLNDLVNYFLLGDILLLEDWKQANHLSDDLAMEFTTNESGDRIFAEGIVIPMTGIENYPYTILFNLSGDRPELCKERNRLQLRKSGYSLKVDHNKLFIAKPDGSPQRRDRMSANFGQLIRHLEMPHIRFHDLRHTAATNMHQLTGDFYTVGEILGHTLKGIGISLGISTNLEAVTAQYVDVRLERKQSVLQTYHSGAAGLSLLQRSAVCHDRHGSGSV